MLDLREEARAGISLSEYIRATAFDKNIVERITPEQLETYKMLVQYKNNFTRIGNMFRKRDPKLAREVEDLAKEIRTHLKNFKK